jgi:hypothetical protein
MTQAMRSRLAHMAWLLTWVGAGATDHTFAAAAAAAATSTLKKYTQLAHLEGVVVGGVPPLTESVS